MVNPLLGIGLGFVLVIAAGLGWLRRRRAAEGVRVAHTRAALQHPRLRKRLAMLRVGVGAVVVLAVVVGGGSAYLAARPAGADSLRRELASRDIMLCLDVSGSVLTYDAEVLRSFAKLVESFEGERVGLSIFNSASRLVFPLTSDYNVVTGQIDAAVDVMSTQDPAGLNRLIAGTEAGVEVHGSSLIGDGLVSCLFSFDFDDADRARTVIFATDNELAGDSVFTLAEGIERAKEGGVVVHGIYISGPWSDDNAEMRDLLGAAGMYYYPFNDVSAAAQIVEAVEAQDVQNVVVEGDAVMVDQPGRWPAIIAGALVVLLAVAWRFKL
ncbi:VWA domain-containing protein [Trueperella bernardiae]|uniref:VWFA domain-containing protein n=1 Tax=Trueperella bernardiae TaxID=59561 RepID=A0A0W1KIS7_9ACTO|nr:VWA domain-containing protein [Trueperella bernardiae]KTF03520.1 hypothetical protein AQZ59_01650 [Trueperella bernardiae]PKZ88608.1 VWA domain-containing protein [Trueperella bernardiae]